MRPLHLHRRSPSYTSPPSRLSTCIARPVGSILLLLMRQGGLPPAGVSIGDAVDHHLAFGPRCEQARPFSLSRRHPVLDSIVLDPSWLHCPRRWLSLRGRLSQMPHPALTTSTTTRRDRTGTHHPHGILGPGPSHACLSSPPPPRACPPALSPYRLHRPRWRPPRRRPTKVPALAFPHWATASLGPGFVISQTQRREHQTTQRQAKREPADMNIDGVINTRASPKSKVC